jgi:hypothetical protein
LTATAVQYGIPNKHGTGWSDYLPYQRTLLDFILNERGKIDVDEWGRGTGKSSTLWDGTLGLSVKYPRLRTLVIAPAFKTLQDGIFTVIGDAEQVFQNEYDYSLFDKWNTSAQNPYIRLANGSEFVFRLGSRIDDVRGGTFGQILIEEGGFVEANMESWGAFLPSLRGYGPHMIHVGGTPSSPTSVLSLLKQFWNEGSEVPGDKNLRRFTDSFSTPPETYDVFYSSAITLDNPHFPRWVMDLARATMSPEMFAQEFEARARKFTGLVCPEFDRQRHVAPFDVRRLAQEQGWVLVDLVDWGSSKAHHSTMAIRQLNDSLPPEMWIVRDNPLHNHTDEMCIRKVIEGKREFGLPVSFLICDRNPDERGQGRRLAQQMLRPHGIAVRWAQKDHSIVNTLDWLHRFLGVADETKPPPMRFRKEIGEHPNNRPGGKGGIVSLEEYRLREDMTKPGEFTNKPFDDNRTAHFADLLRYAGISLNRIGFHWPIVLPLAGQKPATAGGR